MEKNNQNAPDDFNFILCGGAKVPEELISRAKKVNIKVLPSYGMTEASSQIATANPNDINRPKNSVGKILDEIEIKFSKSKDIMRSIFLGDQLHCLNDISCSVRRP